MCIWMYMWIYIYGWSCIVFLYGYVCMSVFICGSMDGVWRLGYMEFSMSL